MEALKPFEMPLEGISLIEASAGTGKTFSITRLYLRMLLELGLKVEQILVVTFTRAATEELRERIRSVLLEALAALEGRNLPDGRAPDEDLRAWLESRGRQAGDIRTLRLALTGMDGAAVFTIHGFCQGVLGDHAFDTGMAFQLQFLEDEEALRLQAAEDFWRHWFARDEIPSWLNLRLLARWATPEALLESVQPRLNAELRLLPQCPPVEQLLEEVEGEFARLEKAHRKVREAWWDEARPLEEFLASSKGLYQSSYKPDQVEEMLVSARRLAHSEVPLLAPGPKLERITASGLKLKKGHEAPPLVIFDALEEYLAVLAVLEPALERLAVTFQLEARDSIREHLARTKAREHQLHFDDLLTALDRALGGEGGEALARRLRGCYPRALIDEFQDTDEVQYRIFHAIWGGAQGDSGLCLIGDPKQAIYGFRGGDIFTYLEAARHARQRYSLDTNWRSCSGLVKAVNALFGANPRPFLQEGIDYQPVAPSPKADEKPLLVDGERPVPLQFWKLPLTEDNQYRGRIRAPLARQAAARACAGHIAGLLRPGRATLGDRPLRAGDIALLARTHPQVEELQQALQEQGIHSVSLSEESVFSSEEAGQLLTLLQAVIRCEDEALLRYALADRLLGLDACRIDALIRDDDRWEAVQQRFFGYRERWREAGFIQAFSELMRREGIAARLLAQPGGERRLTNLLQLVELAQQASRARPGLEMLARWLAEEIDAAGRYEEARLRLESDEALVKIVTMHASKGLEYPVVYIPFPWNDQGVKEDPLPWFYHDEAGRPCLYFGGDPELREVAAVARRQELQAEKLRLFYVAVTRAAQLCVLPWGQVNGAEHSALAWLLYPGESGQSAMKGLGEEELLAPIETLAKKVPEAIEVREPPQAQPSLDGAKEQPPTPRARRFTGVISRDWMVNSYSGLVRGASGEWSDRDALDDSGAVPALIDDPLQRLPAGPAFGLLVHELLESLDFPAAQAPVILESLERLSRRHGLPELRTQAGGEAMVRMVRQLLETRLEPAGLCLAELDSAHRLDEMEFHFSVAEFDPAALRRLLDRHPPWQEAARGLDLPRFRGLMHGYIDLVFERQGRYWLADYKSNRLDGYGPGALEEAMAAHHYPLQGLIYALALHRHLALRLPGYDPERQFGGIFYLFTRGMRPGSGEGVWFRSPSAELLRDLDRFFQGRAAA